MSNYFVRENFDEPPMDWYEVGENVDFITYDPVDKNIDVRAFGGLDTLRYSKDFPELTQDDNFYWEFDIKLDSNSMQHTRAKCGCFRKGHWNTYHSVSIDYEIVDVVLVIYPTLWIRVRSHKGIAYEAMIGEWSTFIYNIDYQVKAWYDALLRKITAKVYEGDILKATKEYIIPEGITFIVDTFGVGNRRIDLIPTYETRCEYDNALLMKFPDYAKIIPGEIGIIAKIKIEETPKNLINEKFDISPPDWIEIGEIATYSPVNKNIDVKSYDTVSMSRYSKEHPDLTINNSFYYEKKIFHKIQWGVDKNTNAHCYVGCFNKDESTNKINSLVFDFYAYFPPAEVRFHWLEAWVYYSDGTSHGTGRIMWLEKDTEYLLKLWYNSITKTVTVKVYSGIDFSVLEGEQTIVLLDGKTFTLNDFGIGNAHNGLYPSQYYRLDYDDAILTIPLSLKPKGEIEL